SMVRYIDMKDFLIMFVHHLATIGLITFSYMNNMVRVGTLVLCLHDASDFLLEVSFLSNLCPICNVFWISFRILNTTLFESWELIGPYPSWWLFNGLLITLQMLHIIWSYLIIRTAYKALMRGKVRFCMHEIFFICSPQLLLQMSYFLGLQLFLYPGVYIFFLSLVLSCPGDLARERTVSSVFFILFSFSLCQIGAGQFHPLHVSVICASVCSLKHICVCFKAKTKAKLWS
uniref:Ceramide synthase 5 n=1 Tax=Buteo japonicus TaxID=224669 RepID=A0A8C0B216_9AVES